MKENIIISAVNLTEGGPLTILKQVLDTITRNRLYEKYEIIALVNNKQLAYFEHIHYIEFPKAKKRWINRVYYEYFYFRKLSKKINVFLWFSLHDTTPTVKAQHRIVYMHNPSPFFKWKWRDLLLSRNYVLFALFYKYLYKINIQKNDYLIVQQEWLRTAFEQLFKVNKDKIIVVSPNRSFYLKSSRFYEKKNFIFFFPSVARPFKNFEIICEAARILEKEGIKQFRAILTLNGLENKYAQWVYTTYRKLETVQFEGIIPADRMGEYYEKADALIFPSKLETWGLPISEFMAYQKPILAADLTYAHETAAGSTQTAFFNPDNAMELAFLMKKAINKDYDLFKKVPVKPVESPCAHDFSELFQLIIPS